jgi:hypothetical protein
MKWICLNRAGFLVLLVISLAACATEGGPWLPFAEPTPYPPPGFAHEVSSPAVRLFWNCTRPAPGTLRLEGMAFNPWSGAEIRFLEFDLVGVDSRGYTVTATSAAARDLIFGMMGSTPFQLELRTTGSEVRFDLFYQYRYQEPGDSGGGEHQASLSTGAPSVRLVSSTPFLLAQATQRFMVRDACSETMHRAR